LESTVHLGIVVLPDWFIIIGFFSYLREFGLANRMLAGLRVDRMKVLLVIIIYSVEHNCGGSEPWAIFLIGALCLRKLIQITMQLWSRKNIINGYFCRIYCLLLLVLS